MSGDRGDDVQAQVTESEANVLSPQGHQDFDDAAQSQQGVK